MIPKVIHYCWFGGNPLPELAQKCIASWKKYCPNYEIKEWNENNFDLSVCDYVKEAYDAKKWAFVSDYARLDIIYHNGGIYLDTDVELLKPLDEFLGVSAFFGAESTGFVATGLGFGAEKKNKVVKHMLDEYTNIHFKKLDSTFDTTPCPRRNTKPLEEEGYRFSEKEIWKAKDVVVFPPKYFCPIDYRTGRIMITDRTYSIHHYSALWLSDEERYYGKLAQKIACAFPKFPHKIGSLIARAIATAKFKGIKSMLAETCRWFKRHGK